jgi:large subunit ribosomal protein L10
MLTRQQKKQQIENSRAMLGQSRGLIFVDFSGVSVSDINKVRKDLISLGAKFQVIKKKLLRVAFERSRIDFNPEQFESQVGTIFAKESIESVAAPILKSGLKILGGYDLLDKKFLDAEMVKFIGQLPPREVLLGQLVGMLATPIKMLLFILKEKGRFSDQLVQNNN